MATFAQEQLDYARSVSPQGDIIVSWRLLLQNKVNRDALGTWGVSSTESLPQADFEPSRGMSWGQFVREIKGILP